MLGSQASSSSSSLLLTGSPGASGRRCLRPVSAVWTGSELILWGSLRMADADAPASGGMIFTAGG
jgi:hypothetical protein